MALCCPAHAAQTNPEGILYKEFPRATGIFCRKACRVPPTWTSTDMAATLSCVVPLRRACCSQRRSCPPRRPMSASNACNQQPAAQRSRQHAQRTPSGWLRVVSKLTVAWYVLVGRSTPLGTEGAPAAHQHSLQEVASGAPTLCPPLPITTHLSTTSLPPPAPPTPPHPPHTTPARACSSCASSRSAVASLAATRAGSGSEVGGGKRGRSSAASCQMPGSSRGRMLLAFLPGRGPAERGQGWGLGVG